MMTWLMPIMLTWLFFLSAPSGLVLYWMVSNMVGVLIQLWINRKTADLTVPAGTPSGKGGPRASEKPGNQKGPKDKGKRKQEQRGSAEAEGF
jgi:YidC/Oxa1 family membrane protein insertase